MTGHLMLHKRPSVPSIADVGQREIGRTCFGDWKEGAMKMPPLSSRAAIKEVERCAYRVKDRRHERWV
jgi:hypothetical protein